MLTTEAPELRRRIYIIGCNATPDDWGNVQAIGMHAVDMTVDILAEQQGAQAARLMINERSGRLNASERSVFISPKPRHRTSSSQRWMDVLLNEAGMGAADTPSDVDEMPASRVETNGGGAALHGERSQASEVVVLIDGVDLASPPACVDPSAAHDSSPTTS